MSSAFQWDETKELANLRKHGVSFDEAASVFENPLAAIFSDPDHSQDELREILVGHSQRGRVLVISYTERGEEIRIVSARVASASERREYEDH